jgi:sigma-B regulation protein RsbQ
MSSEIVSFPRYGSEVLEEITMGVDILQKFNVKTMGHGDTTLVFAHGFGSEQGAWRHQIAAFESNYKIVLFDYLGCGQSDIRDYNPMDYDSLRRYKDDVVAIYKALNLTDTIYIGHSASAMIGMLASLEKPDWFRKLIFVSASPRYLNDGAYVGGFEKSDLKTLYEAMATNYLIWANGFASLAMGNSEKPELGREFARSLSAMRPDIAQSTARVIFEADFRSDIPSLRHPTLILQANKDIAVPISVGSYLAEHTPQSHLILLNAEGHLPHMSAPEEVTDAIRDFIAE